MSKKAIKGRGIMVDEEFLLFLRGNIEFVFEDYNERLKVLQYVKNALLNSVINDNLKTAYDEGREKSASARALRSLKKSLNWHDYIHDKVPIDEDTEDELYDNSKKSSVEIFTEMAEDIYKYCSEN